ncbi:CBS domain-containing protein [Streptomyces sp. W16]|uniref:CBS domain-containing protein n=1 Tax=Streptomyces sp. W16 TaxID=3076631 RepID=UPI00295C2F6E|nr:CBS domain-containing protein [Streptomyces sp. W16]MDV9172384.1 CBS domain-containing protein [Streptomyces sp. W16]
MRGSPHIVSDVMTRSVATVVRGTAFKDIVRTMQERQVSALPVGAGATLAQAARTMARAKVKRLPVVDHAGRLEGVVSRADLLKVFLRDDEEIAEEVRRKVVAHLFPGPASDVRVEVRDGVVRLGGRVRDTSLVPVAARLVRAVEGVVDVGFGLDEPVDRSK